MRWKSICPCYWRGSPHFAGGRWRWINYWDHPQLTGRATCQCQRGLTSPYSLSMTNKMPTTFLVMTDPKELFLFFNISSALLPELGSPAGLNWSFSLFLAYLFLSQLLWVLSPSFPIAVFPPSLPVHLNCSAVTLSLCTAMRVPHRWLLPTPLAV